MEDSGLERFKVIEQCPVRWEAMQGGAQERTCSSCDHSVFNISNMSRREGEELIESGQARGEKICIYYYQAPSGRIVTEECPPAVRGPRRRILRMAAAASAGLALGLTTGCGPAPYPPKKKGSAKTSAADVQSQTKSGPRKTGE
jgi:hypothetical protein